MSRTLSLSRARALCLTHTHIHTQARGHVVADKTWLALQSVVRSEGVGSLFAGIVPTYVKTIPTAMMGATVCVSLVEYFKGCNKARVL